MPLCGSIHEMWWPVEFVTISVYAAASGVAVGSCVDVGWGTALGTNNVGCGSAGVGVALAAGGGLAEARGSAGAVIGPHADNISASKTIKSTLCGMILRLCR